MHSIEQGGKPFMKQQGFHVADCTHHAKCHDDLLPGSSQTSSKLAEGLQGLMDMCNAGSLTTAPVQATASGEKVEVVGTTHATTGVRRLVKSVVRGLKACQEPERASEGLGGTYFFKDEAGSKVAIVKPCDEEPLAPNNPKGFVGRALGEPGLKPTVRVGEAAIREVAAYLLDHDHFAQVPHTVLVKFTHPIFHIQTSKESSPRASDTASVSHIETQSAASLDSALSSSTQQLIQAGRASLEGSRTSSKLGSLQEFVAHDCDTSEMGPSLFSLQDVHRIAILDIRLFNTDRHAGNILVQRPTGQGRANLSALARLNQPQCRLLPIDHGFCLPEALEPPFFEWLHWPQAMMPFSEEELKYINNLDAEADVALLQRELPSLRVESLRTLQVATALLKRCAAAGLNLSEIGTIISRPLVGLDEDPSDLEKMCTAVREEVDSAILLSDDDESQDSDEDMATSMQAIKFVSDGARSSSGLSGAVSLDSARLHQHSFNSQDSASMESSPMRSVSDTVHKAEDLLFDLDEQHSASGSPRYSVPLASAVSVPAPSGIPGGRLHPGLHLSSSFESDHSSPSPMAERSLSRTASPAVVASKPRHVQWGAGLHNSYAESEAMALGPGAQLMAASVDPSHFVTKGFTKGKRQPGRKAPRAHRLKKTGRAYPPPVAGGAPGAANAVFSGLSSEEWELFMVELLDRIDGALEAGQWQQDVRKGRGTHAMQNMGVSCPRF
ncbi:MAG: hypothetical protein FRX49_06665 [Trebouxia sp. A1-2]|nr:MAG: hypothetical protein FRX49_06665 [Trebouxia sp. A1-2]